MSTALCEIEANQNYIVRRSCLKIKQNHPHTRIKKRERKGVFGLSKGLLYGTHNSILVASGLTGTPFSLKGKKPADK